MVPQGPIARRNRPLQRQAYFAIPVCIALLRWAEHTPILPPSMASCACATSFCAAVLPSPSTMAAIIDSVFDKFSPLQPAFFAADAGTTAYAMATIAAAPSNLLIMLLFNTQKNRPSFIARFCERDCSPIDGKFRMNFAREKCDERAMQSLMRNNVFSLHVGKESCCRCIAVWAGTLKHG